LAPLELAMRTVEVEAFCSWSACRMKIRSHREGHVQEIVGIGQIIARIDERLAYRVLVSHCGNGRHLGDELMGRQSALLRIVDVRAVVVEGAECADHADHHRHGMSVAPESAVEVLQLLVQHGVVGNVVLELGLPLRIRQFAV
jgi:hypothetical protein